MEQAGKRVAAEVELIKDEVLVLSLPHHGWRLMHVAPRDYNLATLDPRQRFVVGQRLTATLAAKPSPSTGLMHFSGHLQGLKGLAWTLLAHIAFCIHKVSKSVFRQLGACMQLPVEYWASSRLPLVCMLSLGSL